MTFETRGGLHSHTFLSGEACPRGDAGQALGGQLNASSIAGNIGDFNLGNIVNFGNIVIEENIALQVGVAVGSNASVTNLLGQLNSSSIA